jgi:hypothetical protein
VITDLPDLKPGPFGEIVGEPIDAYHANPAVSNSKLKDFRRLPLLFKRRHIDGIKEEEKESEALLLGQMLHSHVLENALEARYAIEPEFGDLRAVEGRTTKEQGKANKDRRDAWRASLKPGVQLVTGEQWTKVLKMGWAIRDHPLAAQLLAAGQPEVTFRAALPNFSVQCRPDWLNKDGCELSAGDPYFVDLKTVASLSDSDFQNWSKNFVNFGYFRQGPFYSAVIEEVTRWRIRKMFYIVQETSEPFQCQVFLPSERAFAQGSAEVLSDLKRMTECHVANQWPGESQDLQVVDLPDWYVKKVSAA